MSLQTFIQRVGRSRLLGGVSNNWFNLATWGSSGSGSKCNVLVTGRPPLLLQQQQRGLASKKHKAILKLAKGYRGRANRCYRIAINRVEKALQYAYRDRKQKKRDFRRLWIERLNAGVRQHGISYSNFIHELNASPILLDRKVLSNLASHEPFSFKAVVDIVKTFASSRASS